MPAANINIPQFQDDLEKARLKNSRYFRAVAGYNGMRPSRFQRQRGDLLPYGTHADWHVRYDMLYFRLMEICRDMDRNDVLVSQGVDRAVTNTIQDGIWPHPTTGDHGLDLDLKDDFESWGNDPRQCDITGQNTFPELQWLGLRHCFIDGDCFALPLSDENAIQLVEGHRCRTPSNTRRNVVIGILLDDLRRRKQFWFTREDVTPTAAVIKVSDMDQRDAYDEAGNPLVYHMHTARRVSQTRGISALIPVFDTLGQFEDINFAVLVQRQVASMFGFVVETPMGFKAAAPNPMGERGQEELSDGSVRQTEGLSPGMRLYLRPGEKATAYTPNIPGGDYFPHMKLTAQLIGCNIGLPLIMLFMDGSETNFSGWRGAIDQARMGFRRNQRTIGHQFVRPSYCWHVRQRLARPGEGALRNAYARLGERLFRCQLRSPTWPYIEPYKDAQAESLQCSENLKSPSHIAAQRGDDWDTTTSQIVNDRAMLFEKAKQKADELNTRYPDMGIEWRDLANLTTKPNPNTLPGKDLTSDPEPPANATSKNDD